jgi:hypothetical protein
MCRALPGWPLCHWCRLHTMLAWLVHKLTWPVRLSGLSQLRAWKFILNCDARVLHSCLGSCRVARLALTLRGMRRRFATAALRKFCYLFPYDSSVASLAVRAAASIKRSPASGVVFPARQVRSLPLHAVRGAPECDGTLLCTFCRICRPIRRGFWLRHVSRLPCAHRRSQVRFTDCVAVCVAALTRR